jgi:hypothetical protein
MFVKMQNMSVWFFVFFSLISSGACSEQGQGAPSEKAARRGMMNFVKSLDTTIHFYGKVVDQHGHPVDGAEVSVGIRRFSPVGTYFMESKDLTVTTGPDGLFEVFEIRGSELFVREIVREGYEFNRVENRNNSFEFGVGNGMIGAPSFIPDKNNPVIFRLRKKLQNRTFLFEGGWEIQVKPEEVGLLKGKDFVEGKAWRKPGERRKDFLSEKCDLFYSASYEKENGNWHVVLRPGGPNGGIVASDRKLYVAPEDGYKEEYSFSLKDRDAIQNHFLYIRSRSPAIYSRLEINYVIPSDRFFSLGGERVTNPYGDRVLDSVDLDSLTSHQRVVLKARLKAEVRTMLGDGRLPQRPKVMALIEAVKRGDKTLEEFERETEEWKTEKNPNYVYKYLKHADEKKKKGDFEGAVEEYDEYLRRVGKPDTDSVYYDKGRALERVRDFEGALECYHTAMEEFPEKTLRYWSKLVRVRETMGDFDGALVELEECCQYRHRMDTEKLEEVEKELALLEEQPDPERYRKLHSEKVDLTRTLEYLEGECREKREQIERKQWLHEERLKLQKLSAAKTSDPTNPNEIPSENEAEGGE